MDFDEEIPNSGFSQRITRVKSSESGRKAARKSPPGSGGRRSRDGRAIVEQPTDSSNNSRRRVASGGSGGRGGDSRGSRGRGGSHHRRDDESDDSRFSGGSNASTEAVVDDGRGRGQDSRSLMVRQKNVEEARAREKQKRAEERKKAEAKERRKRNATKEALAEHQRREREREAREKKIAEAKRRAEKAEQKKQHTIDQLAEYQRQQNTINLADEDDEGAAGVTYFDGIRTDGFNSASGQESINNAMRQCGNNDDDFHELADRVKSGGRRGKNQHHPQKSSMTQSLSPHSKSKRILKKDRNSHRERSNHHSRREQSTRAFASYQSEDPLDEALQANNQSGGRKNRSMTRNVGGNMNALVNPGQGARTNMASSRSRRRKTAKCADAAARRMDPPGDHSPVPGERGGGNQSSGEKRKPEHRQEHPLVKKRNGRKGGSERDAIDVDADDPSPGAGGKDDGGADIMAALEGCGTAVVPEDYSHLNSPKSELESSHWEDATMDQGANGSRAKISDMHAHLKKSKKGGDGVVDVCSPGFMSKPIPKKNNVQRKEGDWISRNKKSDAGANDKGRRRSTRQGNPTLAKIAKQGGMIGDDRQNDKQKKTKRQSKIQMHPRRETRSRSKVKGSKNEGKTEVIEIDSSSDEEDAFDASQIDAGEHERHKRAVGDLASIDAVRIAIGKKVFRSKCQLQLQYGTKEPYIQFSYQHEAKTREHTIYLGQHDLKEVKYHVAGEDDEDDTITAIAFRITPTEQNGLDKYTSSYNQEKSDDPRNEGRQYISVEARDTDEFNAMLLQMQMHEELGVWCGKDSEIGHQELERYAKYLIEDSRKDAEQLGIAGRTRSGGTKKKKKKSENKLLLVYPFDVEESVLREAASGLKELGGDTLGVESAVGLPPLHGQSDGRNASDEKAKPTRTHYVTIRDEEVDRLTPGEFLNDALVDFWMRWISRGESQQPNSDVHFFTSHFMTTLKDDGPEAVASWTARKNIDIFKKKLIFIPVNANLHWSLCVVVNPGLIAKNYDEYADENEEHAYILFLDSLKMHNKNMYGNHIRKWLCFEWKRLGKEKITTNGATFDRESMPLRAPKIPYQENGCDCGVFVCRYAYSLFMMRREEFTWADIAEGFKTLITKGPAFQFDMTDIARIRQEIGTLIGKLSTQYLQIKEQESAEKKAKKRAAAKSAKEDAKLKDFSESASEDATPASGKEDTMSEQLASSEDGGTAASEKGDTPSEIVSTESGEASGSVTGTAGASLVDKDGDVVMGSSSEEKENVESGSQNNVPAAAEKPAMQGKSSGDMPDEITSDDI